MSERAVRGWIRIEAGRYESGNLTITSELPFRYRNQTMKWYLRQGGKFIIAFATLSEAQNHVTLQEA